jgi:hypothetical protein
MPLGVQEVEAPRMYIQSAHEGGKVINPTHRPPLPPREDAFLLQTKSTSTLLTNENELILVFWSFTELTLEGTAQEQATRASVPTRFLIRITGGLKLEN